MRKKNSNSSVPSGMHSLAQRSQQERRQKMEQQRARTVPQEPMRVPPQQPAHFGRQPMQQVPPPPVQKPEKALSQEALQELQQQATQQPEESAVYNRFFEDISVEEPQTPKKSAPQKAAAAVPPTNSAEPEKPAPKMPPVRDARAMPQMPAPAKPAAEPQQAEPTPEPPKPVEPQATAESAAVSPELLQQVAAMVQQDASGKATLTPELLQKIVAMAQQQTTANPVVSAVPESPAEPQVVPTPEPVVEPAPPQKKSRPARPQRRAPQMPVQTAVPEPVQQPISEPEPQPEPESESAIASPFITTAMLRQMKAEGKTLDDLQPADTKTEKPTPVRRYQGKSAAETTAAPQQEPVRPSFRPVKPQDISIDTTAPEPIPEWFSEEEPPQVAEQRTKYLKNRQPRESVAELTGATEKKPRAVPNGKQPSKAARFFRELFLEDAPVDPEQQKPVLPLTRNTAPQQSEAVVPPEPIAVPPQQPTAEPVAPPMPETAAPAPEQPVIPPVQEAPASPKPEKRPVISHAREEEPEPEPQLESAAFYNRLFNDFPEQPQQPVPPTEEEMAQQQHKKDVIESVKGAVSEAEQPGNPPHKKRLTKREYMQRKAQRFSKTIGVSLLSGVVVVLAVVLLLAPRSTISYEENRVLAEKPKFSLTSLLDGSYTSGWSEYYNDTVPFRSKLKKTISAMMQWTGVQSEEDTVFFGNVSQVKKKTTTPVATTESVETTVAVAAAGNDETNTEPAVTTTVVTTTEDPDDEPAAEIGEGIILDHKRAVCVYGGSFSVGQDYAETLNAYQQDLGSDVQVYSLVAPTAVSYYLPEEYANYTASETENIDNINSYLNGVKPVDAYNALKPHTAEAIYARTDHHWLPLGAYYAAEAFAKVADVPFASLSDYDTATKKDYVGSMYTYTESAVLLDNPEEFTYYIPKNKYKTTYYSTSFTDPTEGDLLMNLDGYDNSMYYLVFMGGDDKITHVETDCKNGRTLVIFKDSYGNALVPCLTSSFENIYVCDMRYFELNAIDFCKQVGCTDLLFAMNTFSATGGNESYLESNRVQ